MNPETPTETTLWKGSPSQWTNLGAYLFCALLAAIVVAAYFMTSIGPILLAGLALPLVWAIFRWWLTSSRVFEITTERVRVTTGMISRRSTELELYRVRDYTVVEPFWLRLIGRGNLILETADRTTPHVVLNAIPSVNALKDQVRTHTERMRRLRGVRDLEIDPTSPPV